MKGLKQYYSVAEVAQILDVSEKSVRDFIKVGELQAVKVGQWRVPKDSIAAFMDARSNQLNYKARSEIRKFVQDQEQLKKGEERTLVIKDYYSDTPETHAEYGSYLLQQLPNNSNVRWRYFFDANLNRARHILWGDLEVIVDLLVKLEHRLEEE